MPRFEAPAVALNGRIYYVGGITGITGDMASAHPVSEVDIFDPSNGQWTRGPDLPVTAPKHHLAITVLDGRIYVLGGFDGIIGRGIPTDAFRPIATTWMLDGAQWRQLADQPIARGAATAQAIQGKIYVAGGAPDEGVASFHDLYVYDPATDQWTARARLPTAREHLASCVLNGAMIVVGGWQDAMRTATPAVESYDPASDQWSTLAQLPTPRGGLGAAVIGSRCYVVGGEDWALPLPGTYAVNESFDLQTGRWTHERPMTLARHGSGVAALNGQVWVIGGGPQQGNSYTDLVEIDTP